MEERDEKALAIFQSVHDAVNHLSLAKIYRDALPYSLKVVTRLLGARKVLLIELSKASDQVEQTSTIQRVLEVTATGDAFERELPQFVRTLPLVHDKIAIWMNELSIIERSTVQDAIVHSDICLHVSGATREKLGQYQQTKNLFSLLNIDDSESFTIFSLQKQTTYQGFIFFAGTAHQNLTSLSITGVKTFCSILSRLMADQSNLQNEWLDKTFLNKSLSPSEALPAVDNTLSEDEYSYQRFSELIAHTIPDSIYLVDISKGKAIYENSNAFLGYDTDDYENVLEFFTTLLHPDDQYISIVEFLQNLMSAKDGEIIESKYRMRHSQGHWAWISERAVVVRRSDDGLVSQYLSVLQDVTNQQQTLLQLQESQERYRNLIEYSTEAIYYINCGKPISSNLPVEEQMQLFWENAFIQECNNAFASQQGFETPSAVQNVKITELCERNTKTKFRYLFTQFFQAGHQLEELELFENLLNGEDFASMNRVMGRSEDGHLLGVWGVKRDITAKRKAEQLLLESERKLSDVVIDTQVGLWEWIPETDSITINENIVNLLGYLDEDFRISGIHFEQLIEKEDLERCKEDIIFHFKTKSERFSTDVRILNHKKEFQWMMLQGRGSEWNEHGMATRVSGTLIDIHSSKMAAIQLAESEAQLKVVLHTLPDLKLRVKRNGTILEIYLLNHQKEYARFLPYVGIENVTLDQLFPSFVAQGLLFNINKTLDSNQLCQFDFFDHHKGQKYFMEARTSKIGLDEAIIVLRDVTPLKEAEQKLNEQLQKVDQKNQQLQQYIESNLQLENFAYIASHDLREPVRTMGTYSQLLLKKSQNTLTEDQQTYLNFIVNAASRLNQLIEGLLSYSRIDAEPMIRETIQSQQLLNEVVQSMQVRIDETQTRIVYESLPETIEGSPVLLRQVFQNLIANAIKFRKPNTQPRIKISGEETAEYWRFSITDNGIGINPRFHNQIFSIFKRLHSYEEYQGTGIGLAMVKRIIHLHGGEVSVASQEDKGSTFSFTLLK